MFISVEGIDKTGKTQLVEKLRAEVEEIPLSVYCTCDPPEYQPWLDLKKKYLDQESTLDPMTEALLFLAGRIDNCMTNIRPKAGKGSIVIADRFSDSWIAYQVPRLKEQLGGRENAELFLEGLHNDLLANDYLIDPDITVLIDEVPEVALERGLDEPRTKFERKENLKEVREVYLSLVEKSRDRIRLVTVNNGDLDSALKEAEEIVLREVHESQ
jgi:dTMP kinase